MKIRIKGNTIRYRLTKSEVLWLSEQGYIEDKTEFGLNTFIYALQSSASAGKISATFDGSKIIVLIPIQQAIEWTMTNLVGLKEEQDIGNQKKLFILIEKDFKCLDETIEDQSDNYPNPLSEKNNG